MSPPLRCIVTGADGFIGRALVPALSAAGIGVQPWTRRTTFDLESLATGCAKTEILCRRLLEDVDAVVHLAAMAHRPVGDTVDARAQCLRVNRDAAIRLAELAAQVGVDRFVFLSTAKVLGEGGDVSYSPSSAASPQDIYAISKWEAERALVDRAALAVSIIRPPLVYGPGVRGNFGSLIRLARLPLPLPLAAIDNRRDLISIDNLVDLIVTVLQGPAAADQILLCADAEPYSLPQIIAAIRAAYGRRALLFPLPRRCVEAIAAPVVGREGLDKLFGNFTVDSSATQQLLGWHPRATMASTLRRLRQC